MAFRSNCRRYASSPRHLDFICFFTLLSASVLHSLLHCLGALVKRRVTQMLARGSKVASAGAGGVAGAVASQERTRCSGSARE
ncbi:hypothetical protein NDU88_000209 [Pleurodeles waltl]|uniref:Secreted protein n=1 Tax=Pleurodeles waltl TaxID=8319 RepID=A0AAV7S3X2_PLEWA|nr:hypothetical protein NDU88_000209 [Pleurodeles waltl]